LDAVHSIVLHTNTDLSIGKYAHSFRLCLAVILRISTNFAWPILKITAGTPLTKERQLLISSFYQDQLPTLNRYHTILCRILPLITVYYPNFTEDLAFEFYQKPDLQDRCTLFAFLCNLWTRVFLLDSGVLRGSFLRRFIIDLFDVCEMCQYGTYSILLQYFFQPLNFLIRSFAGRGYWIFKNPAFKGDDSVFFLNHPL
jgi:hypothetical protein